MKNEDQEIIFSLKNTFLGRTLYVKNIVLRHILHLYIYQLISKINQLQLEKFITEFAPSKAPTPNGSVTGSGGNHI